MLKKSQIFNDFLVSNNFLSQHALPSMNLLL